MYLGKLIGVSPQHLIIQADIGQNFTLDDMPSIGFNVIDRNHTHVGKLTDVFGPTDRPLFSVKPMSHIDIQSFQTKQGELFYSIKSGPASGKQTRNTERNRPKTENKGTNNTNKSYTKRFGNKQNSIRKARKDSKPKSQ